MFVCICVLWLYVKTIVVFAYLVDPFIDNYCCIDNSYYQDVCIGMSIEISNSVYNNNIDDKN